MLNLSSEELHLDVAPFGIDTEMFAGQITSHEHGMLYKYFLTGKCF